MDTLTLWALFFAVGLATFLVRLSFIQWHDSTQGLLKRSRTVLTLLPPAILAALCIPSILFSRPVTDYHFEPLQLVAALVAIIIAKLSRSVLWPVLGGMLCLWLIRWLMST